MKATVDPAAGLDPADLYAAAEADFDRYGAPQGPRRRVHRPDPQLPPERPSRRFPVEGPPPAGDPAVRRDALGHPATLAALRRSVRPVGRPHRAARLRHARGPQRGAARAPRARRRSRGSPSPTTGDGRSPGRTCRTFRRRGGLPGHAEMAGKTLFLKANTGPSGHGLPFAAGEALALKMAGGEGVKVFTVEGEGGLTPGAAHETKNSAWGLGLSNLVLLVDWNDFGIDERPASIGRPRRAGGLVRAVRLARRRDAGRDGVGAGDPDGARGSRAATNAGPAAVRGLVPDPQGSRLRQGRRGESHGTPHPLNSPSFWAARRPSWRATASPTRASTSPPGRPGAPARPRPRPTCGSRSASSAAIRRSSRWLSDRLLGDRRQRSRRDPGLPPRRGPESRRHLRGPAAHRLPRLSRRRSARRPASERPNRAALGSLGLPGSTRIAKRDYGRPLFVVASADLAESTNIAGFGKDFGDLPGWGWYERDTNPTGRRPARRRSPSSRTPGSWPAWPRSTSPRTRSTSSTASGARARPTRSFSYLKYGPMRLFSQLAQDSRAEGRQGALGGRALGSRDGRGLADPLRHLRDRRHPALPERARSSTCTRGSTTRSRSCWRRRSRPTSPIVALHLTRPPVEIPDREALGMPSHFEAARGAYVLRAYRPGLPQMGTVFVQGTVTTANLVSILPELDRARPERQGRRGAQPAAVPLARTPPTARPPPRPPTAGMRWPSPTARSG